MQFVTSFWTILLWPLYFLQQENYNLTRFWSSFPNNLLPKKARQKLIWTKKLILIFVLSLIFSTSLIFSFLQFLFPNDLGLILGYFINFDIGSWEQFWVSQIFIVGISTILNLFLFPIWQSFFYTFSVLILSPIDSFIKNRICQKASSKVRYWQKSL